MSVKLSPLFNSTQFSNNGTLLSGGLLYWYAAGTTTPQNTYTDSTGATPQTNPIVLNSRGEPANPIWLTSGLTYKAVLNDSQGNLIRTVDNISGVNDVGASALSEWIDSGMTPTYVSTTSFSLAGDQTALFHPGRRVKAYVSGGIAYASIKTSVYSTSTLVTLTIDGDGPSLDSGLSSVLYGVISSQHTSIPVAVNLPFGSVGLTATNNATNPNTSIDITAIATTVFNPLTLKSKLVWNPGTITCNASTAGPIANGRDQSGTFAAGWVHFYYIYNGSQLATIASASAPPTGPTLPSGYTYWGYIGAIYNNSTSIILQNVYAAGKSFFYEFPPFALSSGKATSSTTVSLSTVVPPNASTFVLNAIFRSGSSASAVAVDTGTLELNLGDGTIQMSQLANTESPKYVAQLTAEFRNLAQSINYYVTQFSTATIPPKLTLLLVSYTMPNGAS